MDDALLVVILKYVFLGLLVVFVVFVVGTVASRMRVPRAATGGPARAGRRPAEATAGSGSGGGGSAKRPNVVIVRTGGKKIGIFKLADDLRLGRADDCQLRPPDDYLSQQHARFVRRDDAWFVEDLGSTNGTKVNGRLLTGPLEVRAGDEVQAGTTVLELRR